MRNTIFESARIRLTFWYLMIIAFISLSFSAIIYRDISTELTRGFERAQERLVGPSFIPVSQKPYVLTFLADDLKDSKRIVLFRLMVINGIILAVAGIGGYFLAGATLSPIKLMMEDQKRFVTDASHELKTPITALMTEIEVALRNKKLKLKEAKELLNSNLQEVNKMKEFTGYLLSLSKYEANGNEYPKEPVDLAEAANQAIGRNLALAKKEKIKINKKLSEVVTFGHPSSLVDLISILINNAIKYSPAGSEILVTVKKTARKGVVEVKDHGIGINEDDLPHIFDRFYRADCSRCKEVVDGYGLGLSIAKSIVESHRGDIKVESQPNVGSTFRVILPS